MEKFNITINKYNEESQEIILDTCYDINLTNRMFDIAKELYAKSKNVMNITICTVNNYPFIVINTDKESYNITPRLVSIEDVVNIIDNNL